MTGRAGAPATTARRVGSLYPMGTARALFVGAEASAAEGETLPRALWDRLRARDVRAETLLAAWEVSGWPAAPVEERRALAAVIVALGAAVNEGSTSLDLAHDLTPGPAAGTGRGGPVPRDSRMGEQALPLDVRLERLGFDAAEARAAVDFAARLVDGTVTSSVGALFGVPGERRPFILVDRALYPEALWTFESRLAALLSRRLEPQPAGISAPVAASRTEAALAPEQAAAVDAALSQRLTLITGGPGTGKTSTIVALLRALFHGGLAPADVAVAAPTGRAAQRITEALQAARLAGDGGAHSASTVHRLLGLRPARRPTLEAEAPEYHAGWRLPHRFVIVDEASMIDLYMMTDLAAALRDEAHLILVGDADQLPSVRLGAVFRDLCAALPGQTSRLTVSYRMDPADAAGAAILRVAQSLLDEAPPGSTPAPLDLRRPGWGGASPSSSGRIDGQPGEPLPLPVSRRRVQELAWSGVEHLPGPALPELLARWCDDVLGGPASIAALAGFRFSPGEDGRLPADAPLGPLAAVLEQHARARLLCVTRSADDHTSAETLNELMHAHFQRARRPAAQGAADEPDLFPGEPVTILRNDYQRGLWNGEQGIVVAQVAGAGDPLGVAFSRSDGIVVHGLGELADNLGLGYALTVHKAQGSEYDRVALVLPTSDGPLLTREILYTALTRARRSVVVVGDLGLFAAAARRKLQRASGLGAKLSGSRPAAPR